MGVSCGGLETACCNGNTKDAEIVSVTGTKIEEDRMSINDRRKDSEYGLENSQKLKSAAPYQQTTYI
jgi:hypothetical protein